MKIMLLIKTRPVNLSLNTLLNNPPSNEEQLYSIQNKRDFFKSHVTTISSFLLLNQIIEHVTTLRRRRIEFNWLRSKNRWERTRNRVCARVKYNQRTRSLRKCVSKLWWVFCCAFYEACVEYLENHCLKG